MGIGTKIHSQERHAVRRAEGSSCGPPVGHPMGREIGSRANTVTKMLSGWPALKVPCLCIPSLHFALLCDSKTGMSPRDNRVSVLAYD